MACRNLLIILYQRFLHLLNVTTNSVETGIILIIILEVTCDTLIRKSLKMVGLNFNISVTDSAE